MSIEVTKIKLERSIGSIRILGWAATGRGLGTGGIGRRETGKTRIVVAL
jgi:hypothetical protein